MLCCPSILGFGRQECCTVPKKPKEPMLQRPSARRARRLLRIGFFGFSGTVHGNFRDSTLRALGPQECGSVCKFCSSGGRILGTVQYFRVLGPQKCCIVPNFFSSRSQALGTAQHFKALGFSKCCAIPKSDSSQIQIKNTVQPPRTLALLSVLYCTGCTVQVFITYAFPAIQRISFCSFIVTYIFDHFREPDPGVQDVLCKEFENMR